MHFNVAHRQSGACMDEGVGVTVVCRMETAGDSWLKMIELHGKACAQVAKFSCCL